MTKSKILISLCIGVLVGVGFGSVVSIGYLWLGVMAAVAVLVLLLRAYRVVQAEGEQSSSVGRSNAVLLVVLLALPYLVFGFALGAWRIQSTLALPNEFISWYGEKQDFEGFVVTEPDVRQDRQLVTVQPTDYRQRILVTTTLASTFQYGDRVWVRGKVVEPAAFDDFDYPGYLARFSTFALARYPKIIVLESGGGNVVVRRLLELKVSLVHSLLRYYSSDEGNFLLGILIGAKKGLSPEVQQNFARTGTSHVLAVSGFNITIFISSLGYLAYAIGRRWQLAISALCVLVFIIIAGPSASVVRAAGMGALVMLGIASGRLYNPLPALLTVCAGMVMQNPRILVWDIGFQLSAAATAGILLGMPLVEKVPASSKIARFFVQGFGVTLCAILATLPISLFHFGQLSIIAPLANLVIVPLVPFAMGLGALSLVPFVGAGVAWINSFLLHYVLLCVATLAAPSWVSIEWHIRPIELLFMYSVLVFVYALTQRYVLRARKS